MPVGVYSHTHTQSAAASEWTIVHNLGTTAPVVDVYVDHNGAVEKILPANVQVIDSTTVKVVFSSARSGYAAVR